jgi:hypothetical protein
MADAIDHHAARESALAEFDTPMPWRAIESLLNKEEGLECSFPIRSLRRLRRPEEIVHMAIYLASDEASFSTGSVISVDRGMSADLVRSPSRLPNAFGLLKPNYQRGQSDHIATGEKPSTCRCWLQSAIGLVASRTERSRGCLLSRMPSTMSGARNPARKMGVRSDSGPLLAERSWLRSWSCRSATHCASGGREPRL